jgi:hypothetical protein
LGEHIVSLIPWLDSLRDSTLAEIWGILSLVIITVVFLLSILVPRKHRKKLCFYVALGGIPFGLKIDGGPDEIEPGNCSTVGMPLMLLSLAWIGFICRDIFDWFANRRKAKSVPDGPPAELAP